MNYFDLYRKISTPGHRTTAKLGAVAVQEFRRG